MRQSKIISTIAFQVSETLMACAKEKHFHLICYITCQSSAKCHNTAESVCMPAPHQSLFEPQHEISDNVICAISKGSDQPVHTRSLIRAFASQLDIFYDC